MSSTLRVPCPPAWDRLTRALIDYQPPCSYNPELWWHTDPEAVEAAIYGCRRCRVVAACGECADLAREPFGVWAAADRSAS